RAIISATCGSRWPRQSSRRGFVARFPSRPFAVCSPPVLHGTQRGSARMAISFQDAHGPQNIMLIKERWYVASPWRSRHGEALLEARGVPVDPATRQRWVEQDSPLVAKAWHRRTCPVWVSWRLAEPYRQGKGPWYSLSGAVDPHGQTMDFLLT